MNIQAILDEHDVPFRRHGEHHHVTSRFIGVDCPWCGKDSGRFRLGISTDGTYSVCWSCGYHRIGDTLVELTGQSWSVVRQWLDGLDKAPGFASKGRSPTGAVSLPSGLQALNGPHRRYLEGRGFDPDRLARLWGLRGIGLAANLSWRIWIPIQRDGETVSWTTRSIGSEGRRYINARPEEEKVPAREMLYGQDYCRHAVVVCEGPTDVWRLGPGAVATMGLGYSRRQAELIGAHPTRAICFDADPGARRRARRLAAELSPLPGETHVVELESGPDVAEADQEEVDQIRREFLGDSGFVEGVGKVVP